MDVLKLLEINRNQTLSGEVMAKKLHTSRANVWKEISKLRSKGYEIVATPSKGYQLVGYGHNFSKHLLKENLKHLSFDILKKVESTNDLGKASDKINHLIIANHQTLGRGRVGRKFYSPKNKGLYFSYIINPRIKLEQTSLITVAAALALSRALPIENEIKWLNDILIKGKKIAGILVEGDIELQTRNFNKLVVGVGVNLFSTDIPEDLKNIMGTLEDYTSSQIDKHTILIRFIKEFDLLIDSIESNNEELINDYKKLCTSLNKNIEYLGKTYRAIDINHLGHLVVEDINKARTVISSGEIYAKN